MSPTPTLASFYTRYILKYQYSQFNCIFCRSDSEMYLNADKTKNLNIRKLTNLDNIFRRFRKSGDIRLHPRIWAVKAVCQDICLDSFRQGVKVLSPDVFNPHQSERFWINCDRPLSQHASKVRNPKSKMPYGSSRVSGKIVKDTCASFFIPRQQYEEFPT